MELAERLIPSAFLASIVTFSLFWLMQALVVVDVETLIEPPPPFSLGPYVKIHQPPRPIKVREPKPKVNEQVKTPPVPRVTLDPSIRDPGRSLIPIDPITDDSGTDGERRIVREMSDADAIALVRISPEYPARALHRGIEGRVLLEFTIGKSGAVQNVRVIAAEPSSIFNSAAIKAVRQWRYQPKIEDGVAIPQHGIRISIPFRRKDSTVR